MEKMNIEIANKLFEAVVDTINQPESIIYKGLNVKVHTNVPFTELIKFVERVVYAGYSGGEKNDMLCELEIARCIIDDLSDIPMPMITGDDGNKIENLNLCYEIVFGQGGLIELSDGLSHLVGVVYEYVTSEIKERKFRGSAQNRVMEKLLDLYELSKMEINDMLTNPVRLDNLLEMVNSTKANFDVVE